jgi:hypothetical protein
VSNKHQPRLPLKKDYFLPLYIIKFSTQIYQQERLLGATVARRIPDPKVGGSNPSDVKNIFFIYFYIFLIFLASNIFLF